MKEVLKSIAVMLLIFALFMVLSITLGGCGINLAAPQTDRQLGTITVRNWASTASVVLVECTTESVPYVCPVMEFPTLVYSLNADGKYEYWIMEALWPYWRVSRPIRSESMHLWISLDDGRCFEVDVVDSGWSDLTVVVRDNLAEIYDVQF